MSNCFTFFDLHSNDNLVTLNEKEIDEFIKQLLNYKLHLRRDLSISKELTFGLEIEFEYIKELDYFSKCFNLLNLHEGIVKSIRNGLHKWNLETDSSLVLEVLMEH